MEDSRIIDLYWQRDPAAITETGAKYGGYCRSIARNLLADLRDAEECVNDTWLRAWNAMPTDRPDHLGAFLGTITRRLACSRWRAAQAAKRGGGELPLLLEELEGCVPAVPSAAQAAEDRELAESVNRFLRSLPEWECSVFLRRYWYGEPLQVIAERYAMKLNTVKSSLYRTREKLRDHLEQEGIQV